MRALCVLLVLLLPSCAAIFGSEEIRIPVSETATIAGWISTGVPAHDMDGDGVLNNSEAQAFLVWFTWQVLNTYVLPAGPVLPVPKTPST